jgi:DNA (cytosine-5)-methyltransferase 1
MINVQIIDLFSGCGGFSAGFASATTRFLRYSVAFGVDTDPDANSTFASSIGAPTVQADVNQLRPTSAISCLAKKFGITPGQPLIVIGGPPCQGFSPHRKKDPRQDQRNDLLEAFAIIALGFQPEFIIMENVPEIFDAKHWRHFRDARAILEAAGYRVRAKIYNLADFCVPQARFRALVIARRAGRSFEMPRPELAPRHWRTVRNAIAHLPPLGYRNGKPLDPMHISPRHTKRILQLIASIPKDGGSRREADKRLLPDCHSDVDGFRDVYGRLAWDEPTVSITAKCSTPSCGRFLHPSEDRNISVREAANLQGFPEDYSFAGPLIQKYRQIGNAVSPLFSKSIAKHLDSQWTSELSADDQELDISKPIRKSVASTLASVKKRARKNGDGLTHTNYTELLVDKVRPLTVIDCFAGAGGLSLGLREAGFSSVFAFDYDRHAVTTFQNNLGPSIEQSDANTHLCNRLQGMVSGLPQPLTLLAGGPPCQGFSQQRQGRDADERNDLVMWFASAVGKTRPLFFLMENVPYLLAKRGRRIFEAFVQTLGDQGYEIYAKILNAEHYGVPQKRRRVIVVGHQHLPGLGFQWPAQSKQRVTVRDAIGDLPPPPVGGRREHPDFANHIAARISETNRTRISFVPQGGGWKDIPEKLWLDCHKEHLGQGHLDVFGRLSWDDAAATLTAGFDSFSRGRYAHPEEDRPITGREAASLQSFPRCFRFFGPKKEVARQIGNAVPPLLARRIGEAIIVALAGWHEGRKTQKDETISRSQFRLNDLTQPSKCL